MKQTKPATLCIKGKDKSRKDEFDHRVWISSADTFTLASIVNQSPQLKQKNNKQTTLATPFFPCFIM